MPARLFLTGTAKKMYQCTYEQPKRCTNVPMNSRLTVGLEI